MFKKISLIALSSILVFNSTGMSVNAANSTTDNGTLQSQVMAQIASSWVVTVPDSIELAGKTGTYSVTIGGDVADSTSISVVPQSTFTLTDGVTQVTAKVEQENQQWLGSSIEPEGTTETGTITVEGDMSAGTWTGSLDFQVNCTENLSNLMAKVAMMKNLDVYTLGDSILDGFVGWGNSYYGTAEAIDNLYGTKSYKNYAISGATLTETSTRFTPVVSQLEAAYERLKGTEGYKENSVFIFNGGGNDLTLTKNDPDNHNVTVKKWSEDKENGQYDIASTLTYIRYFLTDEGTGLDDANIPFIYIIPKWDALNTEFDLVEEAVISLQRDNPRFLYIDCRDFITEADMCDDFIHLNSSGQTKLAHRIVDVLYDYYN